MNRLLLTFILTALWQFCLAQNGIQLKSKHYEEVLLIPENSRIKIQTKEGLKISGEFQIAVLNNLYIDGELIALEDIRVIKTNTLSKGRKIAGGIILAGGAALTLPFLSGFAIINPDNIASGIAWSLISVPLAIVGVPMAVGGIILLTVKQRYTFYDWEFKIAIPNE
jgi:hypothetical protein